MLIPVMGLAQQKNDNTIIVKGVSFSQVCNSLLDSGYVIESKDNDMQTVKTKERIYPKYWNATYSIYVRVKDSAAIMSVTFSAPGLLFHDDPARFSPHDKAIFCYPLLVANELAKSFNGQISYAKR